MDRSVSESVATLGRRPCMGRRLQNVVEQIDLATDIPAFHERGERVGMHQNHRTQLGHGGN